MNTWAMGNTGRIVFKNMTTPNKKDAINRLERRNQTIIFRLRTQHIPLNSHLNRFNPEREPICQLCPHPYETVNHFLFECPNLEDIRTSLLPPSPNINNTLYADASQLNQTSKFFVMASSRRAQAQMAAGSEK